MATEDFSLITRTQIPPHDAGSINDGDYYPSCESDLEKSGSGPPPMSSSKRHLHHNLNHYKKQKFSGSNTVADTGDYRCDFRKDREEWSDAAILYLLEAYKEKHNQLNRGNLRGRDWEDVSDAVSERGGSNNQKSVEQCKNKIDNLKKRYKLELQRINNGVGGSNWHWYKYMEVLMGSSPNGKSVECDSSTNAMIVQKQFKRTSPVSSSIINNFKSTSTDLKWRRVLLKVSGSALRGNCQNMDPKVITQIASEVAMACHLGLEVAIVVGGRNFFCGDSWVSATELDRSTAYQIGMMATVMNSLLLQSALEKAGIQTRVQSTLPLPELVEPYNRKRAVKYLEKGRVVIFGGIGGGIGSPLFSTDTAAALRASEINADALLKGTNSSCSPNCPSVNGSIITDHISFREAVSMGITSMDLMAITYCEENGIPVTVFNLDEPGNISRALCGERVGVLIDQERNTSQSNLQQMQRDYAPGNLTQQNQA